MTSFEDPIYDEIPEGADFSAITEQYDNYKMSSGDDDEEEEEEEKEELPDNDWGDVDPLDSPLRAPGPMDPSGPGSAV